MNTTLQEPILICELREPSKPSGRKPTPSLVYDPAQWRRDDYGRIRRQDDGCTELAYGWAIEHIDLSAATD